MARPVPELVLFEDHGWRALYPLTLTRPVFDLRVGVTTLGRRLAAQMAALRHDRPSLVCRDWLRPTVERAFPELPVNEIAAAGDVLFLNGACLLFKGELDRMLRQLDDAPVLESGGVIVAARLPADTSRRFLAWLGRALGDDGPPPPWPKGVQPKPVREAVRLIRRPWDLVHQNEAALMDDFALTRKGREPQLPAAAPGAHLVRKARILSRKGARVDSGAVLDASGGPIILGEGARIMPNAVVLGPAYIGTNSLIRIGAKIYGGTSIGAWCKVGGEVEASIFHGYGNKQHDGFVGHSYLGEWTNLGAGTDTSDLKNNYGNVRLWTEEGLVDSGHRLAGLFMGDHSKCGIGTMFNTGTVVGVSANVFGAGYPPKHVPSFSWGGAGGLVEYEPDRAIATADIVVARRNRTFEAIDEALLRTVHAKTRPHREEESGGRRSR